MTKGMHMNVISARNERGLDVEKSEVLKQADQALQFVLETAQQSKEFVVEQAPLIVNEIITWGIVENSVCVVFWAAVTYVATRLLRWGHKREWDDALEVVGGGLGGGAMLLAGIIGTVSSFLTVLQAIFAPRLFILHELQRLLQ
jgi:hypothetical protein